MESTLDEPVSETLLRDLRSIARKLRIVINPCAKNTTNELADWDLWGPLLLCLAFASLIQVQTGTKTSIFGGVFAFFWLGSGVVTLQSKFLGGKISFFQTLCALGYSLFPLCIVGVLLLIINGTNGWLVLVKILMSAAGWVWCCRASFDFITGSVPERRRLLAVYPISLFYFFLAWLLAAVS
eukprot:TRINITY_DN1416_c2_g1_i2.p1 TRINITY_DN1416_c2_g1~~TRINITY_DN1416_c2_g1_i2.p1  ORF type:complete len:182 (+),score=6.79 TRINITY_DN1416_c2_g1_i2:1033-1578(+)